MNSLIEELFKKADKERGQRSADALNALCSLLEKKSLGLSLEESQNMYETYIPKEIIELEINQHEEIEILKFLQRLVDQNHEHTSTILFSMGKARYPLGFNYLVQTMTSNLERFSENELFQSLVSLENVFFDDNLKNEDLEDIKEIMRETSLLNSISKKLLLCQPISHRGLESTSVCFLARMILVLDSENIENSTSI